MRRERNSTDSSEKSRWLFPLMILTGVAASTRKRRSSLIDFRETINFFSSCRETGMVLCDRANR
jgi:hypothetical protein